MIMSSLKPATDLMDDPILPPTGGGFGESESPYDRALDILTVTADDPLELMTRTNPIMARACAVSYSMMATFRSSYVSGRINQVMRLAVSNGGKGRDEIVRSLGATDTAFSSPDIGEGGGRIYSPAPED